MKKTNLLLIVLLAMCTGSYAQEKGNGKSTPATQGQATSGHQATARPASNNKKGVATVAKRPGVPAGIATPQVTKNSPATPQETKNVKK